MPLLCFVPTHQEAQNVFNEPVVVLECSSPDVEKFTAISSLLLWPSSATETCWQHNECCAANISIYIWHKVAGSFYMHVRNVGSVVHGSSVNDLSLFIWRGKKNEKKQHHLHRDVYNYQRIACVGVGALLIAPESVRVLTWALRG